MYRRDSGLSIDNINEITNFIKKNKHITHCFIDHDLTMTCFHGLIDSKQLDDIIKEFKNDKNLFDNLIVYFFGSIKRYKKIKHFLVFLENNNIKRVLLTKQPEVETIKKFFKHAKLNNSFDMFISSIQKNKEKLDIIQEFIQSTPKKVKRSPRKSPKKMSNTKKKKIFLKI